MVINLEKLELEDFFAGMYYGKIHERGKEIVPIMIDVWHRYFSSIVFFMEKVAPKREKK